MAKVNQRIHRPGAPWRSGVVKKGVSAAAAVALVAGATTGADLLNAGTESPAHAAEPTVPADQPGATGATAIDADAIASGDVTKSIHLQQRPKMLSGHAWIADRGTPATMSNGLTAVPDGTVVYMQWIDDDGAVSPFFKAKTHSSIGGSQAGPGTYAFSLPDWKDSAGKTHFFRPHLKGPQYRIWVEPFTKADTGNRVSMLRQAGGYYPRFTKVSDGTLGEFLFSGMNIQRTGIYLYEEPGSYMSHKEPTTDPEGPISAPAVNLKAKNSISGRVWLETGTGDRANSATGPTFNPRGGTGDKAAQGYTVHFSTLTADGAKAADAFKDLPTQEQVAATQKMLKEHPEYIAATVTGKTNQQGWYTLRFPDGVLDDSHIYGWVTDPDGRTVQSYSSFTAPIFQRATTNRLFTPQAVPGQNLVARPMWYNVHFALIPFMPAEIQITNYDVTENIAKPGDTAKLKLTGALSPFDNVIKWTDPSGTVVKECDVTSKADAAACTLEVPKDLKEPTIYTATLYAADNPVSADSFAAQPGDQAADNDPGYKPGTVLPGETVAIDQTGDADLPDGTRFEIDPSQVPDGWKVTVDDKGTVSFTAPKDAKPGDEITVPVTVTYPDGSKDVTPATVVVKEPGSDDGGSTPTPSGDATKPGPGEDGSKPGSDGDGKKDDGKKAGDKKAGDPKGHDSKYRDGRLPRTGAEIGVALGVATGLLALGAGAVVWARRRMQM